MSNFDLKQSDDPPLRGLLACDGTSEAAWCRLSSCAAGRKEAEFKTGLTGGTGYKNSVHNRSDFILSIRLILSKTILAKKFNAPLRVRIGPDGEPGETISIPVPAIRLLSHILSEMAKGNSVTLVPIDAELTTQQAAEVLNVSRPFVIEQMEKGAIPFRKVGTHRRVLFRNLMAYKQAMDQNRLKPLEQFSALDQELGLGELGYGNVR